MLDMKWIMVASNEPRAPDIRPVSQKLVWYTRQRRQSGVTSIQTYAKNLVLIQRNLPLNNF